jgi:tellurite resistance protein
MRLVPASRLARFPVGSFAVVAGLCSFTMALREVDRVLGFAGPAAAGLALLAGGGFLVVAGLYLAKVLTGWRHVCAEFADPVSMPFFPTLTVSLLLLPLVVGPYQPALAAPLWLVAAATHLLLLIAMARRWILDTFRVGTFSPVWVLSVGGNLVAAMTGVRLGFVELSWFFLSSGLLLCGAMFTIFMYRLVFHDRISPALAPSLFIFMTPPSAAFLAYIELGDGQLDALARTLLFSALFVAAILASLAPLFLRAGFSLGWWTCTFPSAALTMAVLRYHEIMSSWWSLLLVLVILSVAVLLFLAICVRTAASLLGLLLPGPRADAGKAGLRPGSARESIIAGTGE